MQGFLQQAAAAARYPGVIESIPELAPTPEERRVLQGNSRRLRRQRLVGRVRMVAFALMVVLVIATSAALARSGPDSTVETGATGEAVTTTSPSAEAVTARRNAITNDARRSSAAAKSAKNAASAPEEKSTPVERAAPTASTTPTPEAQPAAAAATTSTGSTNRARAADALPFTGAPSALTWIRIGSLVALAGMLLQIAGGRPSRRRAAHVRAR